MRVMLLTEHHFEFLSLKGGYTGSSESTLVQMTRNHMWLLKLKSLWYPIGTSIQESQRL